MKTGEMDCCSMHDPTGRRGIWFRRFDVIGDGSCPAIAINAGREGDDVSVLLSAGQTLTARDIHDLDAALAVGRWMLEETREHAPLATVLTNVNAEMERQKRIHPLRPHHPFHWNIVLMEEVLEALLEVAHIVQGDPCEIDDTKLRTELIQVAAVAASWAETLEEKE